MKSFWRRYSGFARCAMEKKLAYRNAFIIGWMSNLAGILVSIFLWRVLFLEHSSIQGYNWDQMILYALIVAMLNATLSFRTEMNLSEKILDGSIVSDLTKPIDFQNMSFFQALGESAIEGGISICIISVLAFLLTDLGVYLTLVNTLLFIVSLILAFLLKFCFSYISGLICFYTSNGYGVVYLRQVITDVFSGALMPLTFFPAWFQKLSGVLPFQASVYLPTQIFLGRISDMEMLYTLLLQLGWVIVMWIFAKLFFSIAVKKITIHGG